jgi:hypothetical protein
MELNQHVAERIARQLRQDGFDRADAKDVWDVYQHGSVEMGIIGDEYDAALESRILQEMDNYGVEPR